MVIWTEELDMPEKPTKRKNRKDDIYCPCDCRACRTAGHCRRGVCPFRSTNPTERECKG